VEEEIPPQQVKIPHHLQGIGSEQMTQVDTKDLVMTNCLVEGELPPRLSNGYKNSTDPKAADPKINWGEFWHEREGNYSPKAPMQQVLNSHASPRSCRLIEEHLDLIFEMRRDLAEQM
jgi:hypothetical protein